MSETLGCGHPDKNRACGDCLDEAEAEVAKLELQNDAMVKAMEKALAILEADDSLEAAIEVLQIAWGNAVSKETKQEKRKEKA